MVRHSYIMDKERKRDLNSLILSQLVHMVLVFFFLYHCVCVFFFSFEMQTVGYNYFFFCYLHRCLSIS